MTAADTNNLSWHGGTVSPEDRHRLLEQKGVVVWMTGLSASGKSTIACMVERMLIDRGKVAYRLDGDNIRHGLNKNLGFSAADRTENIRRIGEVAKLFSDAGLIVLVTFISPYRVDRDAVRANLPAGQFVEVYVKVSLEAAERRDPKGLYKKARSGQITGFTGIDDPYEEPTSAEIVIDTQVSPPDQSAAKILSHLETGGYLRP
jgi:adenylylsulfate kinase